MSGAAVLVAGAALLLALAAPAAAQQDLPPLEELLKGATSPQDSTAIREAYRAATGLRGAAPGEEEPARAEPRPRRDETPADRGEGPGPDGGRPARSAAIPRGDAVYDILAARADTTAGQGPITYSGERLVFYPETEVIVLEGEAVAGQAGTELAAQRILYRSREGAVEAFGEASVSRGQATLGADSLFYDRQTSAVATFGASVLSEGQSETTGVDLRYDLERASGRLGGGVTRYDPWILEGASMSKIGTSTFTLADGYFTTCDLEDPHYTFRADEIKLRQNDVIVARPVVLYFSDIPVFYLPWYVEPVTRGRSSGFLRPKIGINTLIFGSGKERNVQDLGYYYVFGPYADALVAADWYTESRFVMRGDMRYNLRHEFRGALHVEQVWNRLDDSSSRLIRFNHDHTFSRETRANVDLNWSNTRQFLRRNSFDPDEILQRSFRSAASYSTRFAWGSLVAGANADFRLDQARTDFRLPDMRLSINQRPLWGARDATEDAPWFSRLQYSGSVSLVSRLSRSAVDSLGNPLGTIPTDSLGNALDFDEETIVNQQEGRGSVSLSGPLDLFGVIKTTPSVSYNLTAENDRLAEDEKLGGEGRMNAGLSMSTRFFRVFQSVPGPWFTAMRHVVSPNVSLSYSPEPTRFGSSATGEDVVGSIRRDSFTASLSLGNDFEVKMPVRTEEPERAAPADGEAAGEEPEEAEEAEEAKEPEEAEAGEVGGVREPEEQTRTVSLLSMVNTLSMDLLEHGEEGRLGYGDLGTRFTSGLGRDFNVSVTMNHVLVERGGEGEDDRFDPFLNSLTTDFSIRRSGGISVGRRQRGLEDSNVVRAGRGAEDETAEAVERLATGQTEEAEGFGPWSLSLTHSWSRQRDGVGNRQSLGIGTQFLPSPHWSLNYRTNYDITEGNLQGQTLSLVRDLHDWQATLGVSVFPSEPQDRVLISFSVYLRDVPELDIPYRVRRE
ncbi:MAG TPA: putative LPS assembly protein LptD [Gemmatimonadota bacterium]|nr:putative LPS assembly protein LptD [Gemmatimonadota bacterium]